MSTRTQPWAARVDAGAHPTIPVLLEGPGPMFYPCGTSGPSVSLRVLCCQPLRTLRDYAHSIRRPRRKPQLHKGDQQGLGCATDCTVPKKVPVVAARTATPSNACLLRLFFEDGGAGDAWCACSVFHGRSGFMLACYDPRPPLGDCPSKHAT